MNKDQKAGIITAVALLQLSREFPDIVEAMNEEFGHGFGGKILAGIDEVMASNPNAEEQAFDVQLAFISEMARALEKIDG